jgi:hypothetical protein
VDRVPDATAYMQAVRPVAAGVQPRAGVILFTPLLASRSVPIRFRALLAAAFAVAVYAFVPGRVPGDARRDADRARDDDVRASC